MVAKKYYPGDILKPNKYGISHQIDPKIRVHITGYCTEHIDERGGKWRGDYYTIKPIKWTDGTISFLDKEVASKMYELVYRSELGEILYASKVHKK